MFTLTSSLDPFNDCELKTINDLEELKSILHNHKIEQAEQPKVKGEELLDNFGLPKVSFVDLDFEVLSTFLQHHEPKRCQYS